MSEITRRDVLRRLAVALTAAGFVDRVAAQEVHQMTLQAAAAGGGAYTPKALTAAATAQLWPRARAQSRMACAFELVHTAPPCSPTKAFRAADEFM